MLDGLTPDLAPRLVLAIGSVGFALLVLIFVLIFLKRRNSPLFIKGGKSREPRLMVLDAAAVDPKRRLVLIRRDDVEHLIMIGGPTDIVIESGIADRNRPVAEPVTEDLRVAARSVAAPVAEQRIAAAVEPRVEPRTAPVAEPRVEPQPVQPVARQVERPVVIQPEAKPAQPEARPVQPEARTVQPRPSIAADAVPVRNTASDVKGVSAMSSVLYDEDRELPADIKPVVTPAATQVQPDITMPVRPVTAQPASVVPKREEPAPLTATAENALDQARGRVLNAQPAATRSFSNEDAAKALAARLEAAKVEAARLEASRRVQSAQPALQPIAPPVVQPNTSFIPTSEPSLAQATPKTGSDAIPSDFEKLLEAELDASGIFGKSGTPDVQGEVRDNPFAASNTGQHQRKTPLITGATPDLSSEEDVARLLGELAVNRKT